MKKDKEKKVYKKNPRVRLTTLIHSDRKKLRPSLVGKDISDYVTCPICKSSDGYYFEHVIEKHSIIETSGFGKTILTNKPVQTATIFKSKNLMCKSCKNPIAKCGIDYAEVGL